VEVEVRRHPEVAWPGDPEDASAMRRVHVEEGAVTVEGFDLRDILLEDAQRVRS
jgi:hypothetical protein